MPFKPDENLLNYDVFPKVFACGKETEIHIRPIGGRPQFTPGVTYKLIICALDGGTPWQYPLASDWRAREIV